MTHEASLPFPGHALFATRIGVCGLAWSSVAVCAVQLPEASRGETQERMLLGLLKRHAMQRPYVAPEYVLMQRVEDIPDFALRAMGGVQCLLAGNDALQNRAWTQLGEDAIAAGVLGDVRKASRSVPFVELQDLEHMTLDEFALPEFHCRVYAFVRALRPGQTCTYGEVARALGSPGSSRAVGQALGANPFAPIVPCHRVLTAGRTPGGFSGGQGPLTKLRMLEIEGGAWDGTQSLFTD